MLFHQRCPRPPLDRDIASIWVCKNDPRPWGLERVLPTGGAQLIVNLAEDQTRVYRDSGAGLECESSSGSILAGVSTRCQIIDTDEQAHVVGVVFRPGGTLPFVAAPASLFTESDVDLGAVWDAATVGRLRERVAAAEANGPDAMLDALECSLIERRLHRATHPAVKYAVSRFQRRPGASRVQDVAHDIGMSPKRFIERFTLDVGVTPKRFCRLLRFQQTVARAHVGTVDWAALAQACGYFDQAHMIHDFRAFSGLSPTEYDARRTTYPNHVKFLQSVGD